MTDKCAWLDGETWRKLGTVKYPSDRRGCPSSRRALRANLEGENIGAEATALDWGVGLDSGRRLREKPLR